MLILIILILSAGNVLADVSVQGYYRKNGTYVEPHHRSDPNSITNDNWSTRGNINPYTGTPGTRESEDQGRSSNRNSNHLDMGNSGSRLDLDDHPLELKR